MSVGAVNAFAGIWLVDKGMTATQIGVIFAVPVGVIIFINVFVGRLADRADDWRQIIVMGAWASALTPFGLIFATDFWGILLVWTLAVVTQMMILPVTDAASMRLSRRSDQNFSLFYAWKTIGYLLTVIICGLLLNKYGAGLFLPLFIALSVFRGVAALGLPAFRNRNRKNHAVEGVVRRHKLAGSVLVQPVWRSMGLGFTLPLVAWALVHCTHFVLNGFLGVLWHQQGMSSGTIGLLIGVSSVAEVAMFLGFRHIIARFAAHKLILLSCSMAIVRWAILAFSPGLEVLFIVQLLHAMTYALGFLACTNFIADCTSEDVAAEAQSFFVALQSIAAILLLVGFGWLAEYVGAKAFLVCAGLALLGAVTVIISGRFELMRSRGS